MSDSAKKAIMKPAEVKLGLATARPWHVQEYADAYTHIVRGPTGQFICSTPQGTDGEDDANVRLIVEAVNTHQSEPRPISSPVEESTAKDDLARHIVEDLLDVVPAAKESLVDMVRATLGRYRCDHRKMCPVCCRPCVVDAEIRRKS